MFGSLVYKNQPKVTYLYLALQMLESFSYFGVNFLLVLYMSNHLNFEYAQAFSVFAVYIALTEGLGILGGRFVDRLLGLYKGLYAGAILISLGYICLASLNVDSMYLGLSAIAVGKGMYNPSLTALLGECYGKGDLRRDAGFTYFYVSLNVGACLATAMGGYMAAVFGWQYVFYVFSCALLVAIALLYSFRYLVSKEEVNLSCKRIAKILSVILLSIGGLYVLLSYHDITVYFLTIFALLMLWWMHSIGRKQSAEHRQMMNVLLVAILMLALFYSFQWQINLSLIEFSEKFMSREFFGIENVSIVSLLLFNPLGVVIFGPLIGFITEVYELKKHHEANLLIKMSIGFFIIGCAYAVLHLNSDDELYTAAETMAFVFLLIGIAEVFIDPAVFAYASEAAPDHMHATVMGSVMLGFSISGLGSGFIASFIAYSASNSQSIEEYSGRFIDVSIICIAITMSLVLSRVLKVYWVAKHQKR